MSFEVADPDDEEYVEYIIEDEEEEEYYDDDASYESYYEIIDQLSTINEDGESQCGHDSVSLGSSGLWYLKAKKGVLSQGKRQNKNVQSTFSSSSSSPPQTLGAESSERSPTSTPKIRNRPKINSDSFTPEKKDSIKLSSFLTGEEIIVKESNFDDDDYTFESCSTGSFDLSSLTLNHGSESSLPFISPEDNMSSTEQQQQQRQHQQRRPSAEPNQQPLQPIDIESERLTKFEEHRRRLRYDLQRCKLKHALDQRKENDNNNIDDLRRRNSYELSRKLFKEVLARNYLPKHGLRSVPE